ncbi:tetratricopeptide repeat protein [Methylobacterium crusticola]|nr:transcriptional regulator [Methylobacterium crusticola]
MPLALPDRPSIAVLPFRDVADAAGARSVADGVTEHLTETLACTPGLFVSGRNSAFTVRRGAVGLEEVGRVLGVASVLEGRVESTSGRVRLTACLSATDGTGAVWSERFEGDEGALPALQAEIVARTLATIAPGRPPARPAAAPGRAGIGIYAPFLSAYASFSSTSQESIRPLLRSLAAAAQALPDEPLPRALMAQCHTFLIAQGWSTDPARDGAEGLRCARAALAMASAQDSPAILMLAGNTLAFLGQEYDEALRLLGRSLALNPNSAAAYERSGWVRCYVGEPARAAELFRAAKRQSPLDRETFLFDSGLALALCMQGAHEEAVAWARRAVRDKPSWTSSYRILAASLAGLGRRDEAAAAARALLALEPSYRVGWALRLYRPSPGRDLFVQGMRAAGLPE